MESEQQARLEGMERAQKELQDQLSRSQQEAREQRAQVLRVQQELQAQLTRTQEESRDQFAKIMELLKGKGPAVEPNPTENINTRIPDSPQYPPGFTPPHGQAPPRLEQNVQREHQDDRQFTHEEYNVNIGAPEKPPFISIGGPSQGQGFTILPGASRDRPLVPDFDDAVETAKLQGNDSKNSESAEAQDKLKLMEERLRAIEGGVVSGNFDAQELSLVPGLVIPPKFKVPVFDKFNGTSDPTSHLIMYCRKMAAHAHDDKMAATPIAPASCSPANPAVAAHLLPSSHSPHQLACSVL